MDYDINISVKNLNETKYLAKVFSLNFTTPLFISLKGEIGTGKTTFANFFVNHLSEKKTKVLSPTFPIVNIYKVKIESKLVFLAYRSEIQIKRAFNFYDGNGNLEDVLKLFNRDKIFNFIELLLKN